MLVSIGGTSVLTQKNSISIDDAIEERSTASFVVVDVDGSQHYQKGQQITIRGDGGGVFAGVIDTAVEARIPNLGGLFHQISGVDWHYLSDKRIVAKAYANTLAGDIVRDLVASYLADEGITHTESSSSFFVLPFLEVGMDYAVDSIQDGPAIIEAVFNYVSVTTALDSLAERTGFWWYIDKDKILHFKSRATYMAPWALTDDEISNGNVAKGSLTIEHGNPKYRNRQYIIGGKDITDLQTEIKKGDGSSQSFVVGFPVAKVPTITIDGVTPQTAGIRGVDTGKNWYWAKGDSVISQEQGATPLTALQTLHIVYQGEFSIVVISQDGVAVQDRVTLEGGTGYVEDVANEPNITTREAAFQSASQKLSRYGVIGRKIKFKTRKAGLAPGQLLPINLSLHNLNDAEALIESVSISTTDPIVWYTISAVEGPVTGSWAKLFYAMATNNQAYIVRENISEEQVLVTLGTFSKTWIEGENPNIFRAVLPGAALFPGASTYPQFDQALRVRYMAWFNGATELGRKAITQQTGNLVSTTYLSPFEANVTTTHLGWFGGIKSTSEAGTGVLVDYQAYAKTKTSLEAIQIDKTDTKGW